MKEITVRLQDGIAKYIAMEARTMGLTSEELMKYIAGKFVQEDAKSHISHVTAVGMPMQDMSSMFRDMIEPFKEAMDEVSVEYLKKKAEMGALSCNNCTMKLSVQDVVNKECGSCKTPLSEAIKEK